MSNTVTRQQAETVLADIVRRYAPYLEGIDTDSPDYPTLLENWEPYWASDGHTVPWAILWESGPDEWAYRYSMGGFNEELATLVADEVGPEKTREMAKEGAFTEQPAPQRKGVYMECGTYFILCLFPDN